MKSPQVRIRETVLIGALSLNACSLQDFDALGAGSTTGGVNQGVGGSETGGDSTATAGGSENSGGTMGTISIGGTHSGIATTGGSTSLGTTTTGGRANTGGAASTGGRANTGGATSTGGTQATAALVNPSFESGSTGWATDPASELGFPNNTAYSVYVQGPIGTATVHQGSFQLSVYNSTRAYQIKVYQKLKGLADGQYAFSGWFARGAMTTVYLYATGCGGADPPQSPIPLTDIWTMVSVTGINVVGGQCEVGFYVEGGGADWLNADDFAFVPAN